MTKGINTANKQARVNAYKDYLQAEKNAKDKYIALVIAMINESSDYKTIKDYMDYLQRQYKWSKAIKNEWSTIVKFFKGKTQDLQVACDIARDTLSLNNKHTILYMARHNGEKPTEKEESKRSAHQNKTKTTDTDTETDTDTDMATPLVNGAGLSSAPALLNNKNLDASLQVYINRLYSAESIDYAIKILQNKLEYLQDLKNKKEKAA